VRFKGFTDDWELCKFKDITTERNERLGEGELLSVTINKGIIKSASSNRKNNSSADMSNYKKVYKNDIAYNSMRMWQGASGVSQYEGIVSPAYTVFYVNPKMINNYFVGYIIKSHIMMWNFRIYSQGLTSDTWNLKYPLFSEIHLEFPSLEEQNKITKELKTLDSLIQNEKNTLKMYESMRKGLLQQLFPSDSSNNPNVRFKGFTENWREYRFKDITSERNERSGVGELLSVTINNGIIKTSSSNRKNNSSVDMSNYKKVYKNDIAYNSMRMWQGASGISLYNGIVSPAYTVFHVNTKIINSDFIGYVLKLHNMTWKFRINSQGLTSDTWNLKYPLFSKINMKSPYLSEQSKISKLLKKLDGIIVLHHRQLEIYEMQRKYFLQKLFV